jgi:carnitine monooxygenase subunit
MSQVIKTEEDGDVRYADPQQPINYEPFRLSYRLPNWKDTRGLYAKRSESRDYGSARHYDKDIYWSPQIMKQEWDNLWSKVWLLVGHMTDIPTVNSFMKVDIGVESFLVVRDEGDKIHAMYNVCQHRGTQLVTQDFGKSQRFVCPFHRWEYSTGGKLLKIEDRETFRADAICHDLNIPHLKVAAWRGWIFANMDPNAKPLEEYLGKDFMEMLCAYDFEKVLRIRDVVQTWPMNWKTAHEGFNEGYHVQATHPQLNGAVDAYHAQTDLYPNGHARSVYQFMSPTPHIVDRLSSELAEEHKIFLREAGIAEGDFPNHWSEVPKAIIEAKRKKKGVIDYQKFSEGQLVDDWGVGFFPSTETFLHPEGFFVQHWWPHPTDPEQCIYRAQVYAVPGIGELPSFMGVEDPDLSGKKVLPRTYLAEDQIKETGPVIAQDRALLPRLQSGMKSRGFKGGVFSEQEVRIRQFYDEYHQYLRGAK